MIQLNLLPDVKVQFVKAKHAKHMVLVVSILAIAISVALLVVMISLTMFQKRHISGLNKDIATFEKSLNDTPDLAKILTIQNQLNSLPSLYAKRPVTSRLFPYVEQTTPAEIGISHLAVNFVENTLSIQGTADSLESVNRYVDTIKFTNYTVTGTEVSSKAFLEVVLSSFSRDATAASYTVTLKFDPAIFDGSKEITLSVPKTITTRSETELPSNGVFDTKVTQ